MPMGEMVVSSVVSVLIEKLISGPLMNLARYERIDSQLNKWKKALTLIQDVLVDAGHKHITQRAVESWLHDLQDLAYDMEDVLDDMATEALKRELNLESDASTSTVRKFIKSAQDGFTHFVYGRNISSKLDEITIRLNDLLDQKNNLGLDVNAKFERSNYSSRRLETSLVDESKVLGREGDKEALLEKLLGDEACNQDVSIVSIVGLGGIGKTTLAKVLYNDDKVKDHFELRAWVCVSDEFDVFSISRAIYQAVTGEDKSFASLDLLHEALKEKLSKKRFLIVLDDVWNEDHKEWEILERPLVGVPSSKIIVTTRKTTVASVMNSVQPHILKVLSDEYALSLFAKYALDEHNFDKHPSLIPIAQGIIKKCDGLPLALIALGRVLKSKGSDEDVWEQLLKSEIWNSQDQSGSLPALKLSYYDLPSHLKQLFAYCCLFPKDYLFIKNELVLLWMAEGFLNQPKGNMSMESLGCQYFEELQSRSFFQHSVYSEFEYTMHDLMNDLAIRVAGEFFCMLDEKMDLNGRIEAFEKLRHFSFIGNEHAPYRKFNQLHRATRLRTFLKVPMFHWDKNVLIGVLRQLEFLRVLNLSNCKITEVPPFIGSLKHLRYLNFSRTSITKLPEQVSQLYHLQSLLVRDCRDLASLPLSFMKLINLRHLDIKDTPLLNKTPLGIGGLTHLQTLPKVFIVGGIGFKISELKDLVDLQGELFIKGLEKAIDPIQAKDANLQQKKGLADLHMEWSQVFDASRNLLTEYEVLEWLKPHCKLKTLGILFYGGVKFPSWLGDPSFNQLRKVTLIGCRSCTQLPTSDGDNDRNVGSFPHLVELCIRDCPKLAEVSIGLLPLLEVLHVEGCSESVLRSIVGASSSIRRLTLYHIKGLAQLNGDILKHLRALEYLKICCNELRYLWNSESKVSDCNKLVSMGEKEEVNDYVLSISSSSMGSVLKEVSLIFCQELESYNCPNSVENLSIGGCYSMTSLTFLATLQELPSSLESLRISYCRNLMSFPHEHLQSLTSLEVMEIRDCESMDESFPCGLWPPNLRNLTIGMLNKPMSEWGLQNYPSSLVELVLLGSNLGVTSFAMEEDASNIDSTSFLLPSSLTYLTIDHFEDVESISEVLQNLTHLRRLHIYSCPNIKDVPQSTSSLTVMVN